MVPTTRLVLDAAVPSVPLFPGVPGGVELLIVGLLLFVLAIAVAGGLGYWVYRDASRRGNDVAGLWGALVAIAFLAGLLPGVAALAVYLVMRDRDSNRGGGREGAL